MHDKDHLAAIRAIARGHGGECLSPTYHSTQTKMRFRCAEGHEWEATPASIKTGRWCRECALARMRGKPRKKRQPSRPASERHGKPTSEDLAVYRRHLRELLGWSIGEERYGGAVSVYLDETDRTMGR